MDLRQHLQQELEKDFKLLQQLEERRRCEDDPRRKLKLDADIEEIKQLISQKQSELDRLDFQATKEDKSPEEQIYQQQKQVISKDQQEYAQNTSPVPTPNLPAQIEEKKKELYIIFSIPQNQENLKWQKLKTIWKQSCGGELSEPIPSGDYWSFTWSDVERQKLLHQAEIGALDKELARLGGQHILEILQNGECLYQFVPPVPLENQVCIRPIGLQKTQAIASKVDVLLLTVTDPEREAVLSMMRPLPGEQEVLQGSIAQITYRFGLFGNYYVAQTESTMGSVGRAGSLATTMHAINELKPKAVLLLGIAFGVNRNKQRLCDVLVAESIFSYELQKIQTGIIINRGRETPCGLTLSERFRTRRLGWELPCAARPVKVHQGLVLSGEKLINDKDFRDRLIEKFPSAVGGEMEGAGAYDAAERAKDTEIILIKAICDWADGSKNDRAQPYAAYAAVSLAHYVLIQPDVLSALGVQDVPENPWTAH